MKTERKMTPYEFFAVWLMPVISMAWSYWYWIEHIGAPIQYLLFLWIPLLALGYIAVVIATSVWKLWSWRTAHSYKGYFPPQIGFIWAGYGNIVLLLNSKFLEEPTTLFTTGYAAIVIGITAGAMGMLFDLYGMEDKFLVVYNRAYYKKLGHLKSVASYGLFGFTALGVLYGLVAKVGYHYLVELNRLDLFAKATLIGSVVICVPPMIRFYLDHKVSLSKKKVSAESVHRAEAV